MTEADDSNWVIVTSRFRDPLDALIAADPDDPFVQMLAAQREQVKRRYEEITASVPEGLSLQQRDEYVSARIMGTIGSDVASAGPPFAEDTNELEKPWP